MMKRSIASLENAEIQVSECLFTNQVCQLAVFHSLPQLRICHMIVASSFQEVFQLVVDGDNDLFADLPQCCHHLSLLVNADAQQSLKHIWVRHEALAKQGIKFLAEGICRVCSPSLEMFMQLVDINTETQVMDILSQQFPAWTSNTEVSQAKGSHMAVHFITFIVCINTLHLAVLFCQVLL